MRRLSIAGSNMFDDIPNINHLWSRLLVEELVRGGVCCFGLSPGSRCTPLTMAVAENPRARHFMHFDERGAAYHALGWAKASGRPAALVCTSGTAVANYLPAVAEASMARVPLILPTADRPPELLDCGANQAIDQTRIFGDYVRWSVTVPCPDAAVSPAMLLTTVDQALYRATRSPAGPVHLNGMFREPLAPTPSDEDFGAYLEPLSRWQESGTPFTTWHPSETRLATHEQRAVLDCVNGAERGLLVVGQLHTLREAQAVNELAQALHWPVFPDVTSGLRLGHAGTPFVSYYDQLLLSDAFRERRAPAFVLHVGGAIASKRLIEHLAAAKPEYLCVADHPLRHDPMHQVTQRVEAGIPWFCRWLAPSVNGGRGSKWCATCVGASQAAENAIDAWLADADRLTEIEVARVISRAFPGGSVLFLGNSMPIRDMDMYGVAHGAATQVAANRGASGIDGNIATAAAHANALECPVTAVLGDLAALHDLNSLALLRETAAPVVLVVVNNDGGGIFSFLPVAAYPETFEHYFGAPHGFGFAEAAQLFGLAYVRPATREEFEGAYATAVSSTQSTVLEVRSNRDENIRDHRDLQAAIAAAVDAHFS